jgi:MYXO-CTERM domain-containing protein
MYTVFAIDPNVVPEPSTLIIWGILLAVAAAFGWRRRRRQG